MYVPCLFLLVVLLERCDGYKLGPPLEACGDMFPTGHRADQQNIPSPFTFTLNATTYRPNDVIEVFLKSSGDWFMEGVLIQVRASDCALDVPAVGTFSVEDNDTFIKPYNCFNKTASAIGHYAHDHIHNRTFYWTAPPQSVGDVHLRATIARNQKTFWTNVMSETILDTSDNKRETCGASITAVTISTILMIMSFNYIMS